MFKKINYSIIVKSVSLRAFVKIRLSAFSFLSDRSGLDQTQMYIIKG